MTDVTPGQVSTGATVNTGGTPSPSPAPAPSPSPSPSPSPTGTGAAVVLQPDFLEWGKTKGYADADLQRLATDPVGYKIATSYREAERMLGAAQGADRLAVPKDPADKAGWDAVYTKLGRPEKPDAYKFEIPQGGDSGFALEAGKWMHEAGLNQSQATTLNKQWNTYVQQATERQALELSTRAAEEVTGITKEWGANVKINSELAARGANFMGKQLGLTPERMEAIKNGDEVRLSAGEALKLFKLMGDLGGTAGDTFEGVGPGNRAEGMGMTPEQAQAKLNQLQNDRAFYDRLQRKDAAAIKERDDLFKIIGGKAA
jgi:hypothetical protein